VVVCGDAGDREMFESRHAGTRCFSSCPAELDRARVDSTQIQNKSEIMR
jgi:hypothetical protein